MQKPTYNDLNTWLEHAIQERDHLSVKVETLQDDLEKTRKALDVAVDALKIAKDCCSDYSIECLAHKTLEQITALEQKDNK